VAGLVESQSRETRKIQEKAKNEEESEFFPLNNVNDERSAYCNSMGNSGCGD
jgi:hypothetical protein